MLLDQLVNLPEQEKLDHQSLQGSSCGHHEFCGNLGFVL